MQPKLTPSQTQLLSLFDNDLIPSPTDTNSRPDLELPGQLISIAEEPTELIWKLTPLYIDAANGDMLMWQIGFDPDSQRLSIYHGFLNGEKQLKSRMVTINNSGRSLQEQALQEAQSRYKKKYQQGYRPINDELPSTISPMLANKYWSGGYDDTKKRPVKTNIDRWPVAVQAKLDGIRSLISQQGNDIIMRSRLNHQQSYLDHIREQLKNFFIFLPENVVLDGELYSHDLSFNTLSSVVKTIKFKHPLQHKVQYYIFDIIEPNHLSFEDRYSLLFNAYRCFLNAGHLNQHFHLLSISLAYSHDDITSCHNQYVSLGYEGLMIRKLAGLHPTPKTLAESQYKSSRSNNLLKVKHFLDEEGTIIYLDQGTGPEEGLAIFIIRDQHGHEFPVRPRGSFQLRSYWFNNPQSVLGKAYTYRFFERTESGAPRFPTGVCLRDYE